MPHLRVAPDCELFHRDECFADPWESPAAALLLHGNAESGEAWNGWMPTLGRRLRVVRPDMRGFGRSAPMPRDFAWSVDRIVDGYVSLADALDLDRFHLAAAKVAGPLAVRLAARHPGRVRSLVLLGTLVSGSDALGDRHAAWLEHIERHGVESWARWTMPGRLGGAAPPAVAEGWARLMGATPLSTQLGFIGAVPSIDVRGDLARRLPDAGGDDRRRRAGLGRATRGCQRQIRGSEIMVVPGDSCHVAATHAEARARATLDFVARCAPG